MRDATFTGSVKQSRWPARHVSNGEILREAADVVPYRGGELAAILLSRAFQRFPDSLAVRLWSHARALEYVSESTYRVWRLYMAACALEFETGQLGIYQVLVSKRGESAARLPLTRRHLYRESAGSVATISQHPIGISLLNEPSAIAAPRRSPDLGPMRFCQPPKRTKQERGKH